MKEAEADVDRRARFSFATRKRVLHCLTYAWYMLVISLQLNTLGRLAGYARQGCSFDVAGPEDPINHSSSSNSL